MGYLKFEIRLEIKLNFYMDQFVTEFSRNPPKWRALLTPEQREKIQTFVNNIADVTPKTDKLALEARIIARRHPHIAVVKDDEDDDSDGESPVVISAIKGNVKSRAKKAVPVAQESESEEEPIEVVPVKKTAILTKTPAKKSASKAQHDSEGEEIYSDEANYESDESEEVVEKNNDYIPKADSESE